MILRNVWKCAQGVEKVRKGAKGVENMVGRCVWKGAGASAVSSRARACLAMAAGAVTEYFRVCVSSKLLQELGVRAGVLLRQVMPQPDCLKGLQVCLLRPSPRDNAAAAAVYLTAVWRVCVPVQQPRCPLLTAPGRLLACVSLPMVGYSWFWPPGCTSGVCASMCGCAENQARGAVNRCACAAGVHATPCCLSQRVWQACSVPVLMLAAHTSCGQGRCWFWPPGRCLLTSCSCGDRD